MAATGRKPRRPMLFDGRNGLFVGCVKGNRPCWMPVGRCRQSSPAKMLTMAVWLKNARKPSVYPMSGLFRGCFGKGGNCEKRQACQPLRCMRIVEMKHSFTLCGNCRFVRFSLHCPFFSILSDSRQKADRMLRMLRCYFVTLSP